MSRGRGLSGVQACKLQLRCVRTSEVVRKAIRGSGYSPLYMVVRLWVVCYGSVVEDEPCETHHAYDKDGMHADLLPLEWDFEIYEAERYRANRDAAYQCSCVMVRSEVGPIHKHDGGGCDQTNDYRAESGEDSFDHSALVMLSYEMGCLNDEYEGWHSHSKSAEDTSEHSP